MNWARRFGFELEDDQAEAAAGDLPQEHAVALFPAVNEMFAHMAEVDDPRMIMRKADA